MFDLAVAIIGHAGLLFFVGAIGGGGAYLTYRLIKGVMKPHD